MATYDLLTTIRLYTPFVLQAVAVAFVSSYVTENIVDPITIYGGFYVLLYVPTVVRAILY